MFRWLSIALLSLLASLAWAGTPVEQFSADTPMRADALPQADFDAIVAEAQSIAEAPRTTSVIALPAHWKTLDAARLVAMMRMPGFAGIPHSARGVLLDQAATWDLLAFRRPSDAGVLWERLWPRAAGSDPGNAPNGSTGIGYSPDPTWSTTARAMSTIFACFPAVAWSAPEDPAVWVVRHPDAWQWRNESGWEGFRRCAPDGAFFDESRPDKAGQQALVALLRKKFTDELLADGCSRPGPDSCMLLFQALFSLDPRDPQLPHLLKVMEPSFQLGENLALPATADPDALYAVGTDAWRKQLFLTLKLPVLLRYPGAWRVGELDRTLEQATSLTLLLARIDHLSRRQTFDRYFSNPWQWIDTTQDASIAESQRKLGADYARRESCALASLDTGENPSFWQGYVLENIRLRHGACDRFNALRVPEMYSRSSMAIFQPIAAALTDAGPIRELALDAMAETCAAKRSTSAGDPLQLCAGVKARDAERAAVERERIALEKAAQPPVDALACEDGTAARAAEALHFAGDADFWSGLHAACRIDPAHRGHALVALAYHKGEEQTGEAVDDSDSDFLLDLDVVVMNLANGAVVAHRHEAGAIPSDAVRLEDLHIDTGRYALAPGKRAFGIRTSHSAHCYQCAYSDSDLGLYLVDGKRIDRVLQVGVAQTRNEELPVCPDAITESTTEIRMAPEVHHGLSDLLLVTTSKTSGNSEDPPPACTSTDTKTVQARFDGHVYRLPSIVAR